MSFRSSSALFGAALLVGCNALTGVDELERVSDDASIEVAIDTGVTPLDTGTPPVVVDSTDPLDTTLDVAEAAADTADACEAFGVDQDMDGELPTATCGTDCNDRNNDVFSKQLKFFGSPYSTGLATSSFDYDCNGVDEPRFPDVGGCTMVGGACTLAPGWASAIPACGKAAKYITNCARFGDTCIPQQNDRVQQCR